MSIIFDFFDISQKHVDVINLFFQNRQQWHVQIIDLATHLQALEQADVSLEVAVLLQITMKQGGTLILEFFQS